MAKRPATRSDKAAPANRKRPPVVPQRTVEAPRFFRRNSVRLIGAALALFVVAGIAGAAYLTRGAHEVSVDQAVDDFRTAPKVDITAETPAPSAQPATAKKAKVATGVAPAQPSKKAAAPSSAAAFGPVEEGVYVYETQGYEQTDALSGQRHDYPSETSMTFKKDGCGWVTRWQPLSERWEESEFCDTAAGMKMKRYTMYHEFFRRGQREDFACDGYVHKKADKPGDTWTFACKSPQSTATSKTTVIGYEDLKVDERVVRTIHIRYDITASGANRGKLVQDRWLLDSPRRMVRLVQTADLVTDSPFGPVGYKESLKLDLKSLSPRT